MGSPDRECGKCRDGKPATEFHKSSRFKDGLRKWCKTCERAAALNWRNANRERAIDAAKRWKIENVDREIEYRKTRYLANREHFIQKASEWGKRNPERKRISGLPCKRARQIGQSKATPKWANRFFMKEIYSLAILRSRLTGVPHEVDHEVPLNHPRVCGLHCEANLAVITKAQNRAKRNTTWPGM